MDWLNIPSLLRLIITNTQGMLAPHKGFPSSWKQKLSYFVKTQEIELTVENIRQVSFLNARFWHDFP